MDALRVWRKARKLTQDQLARQIGSDKFQVSRWEHGKHRPSRMAREQLRRLGFAESQ